MTEKANVSFLHDFLEELDHIVDEELRSRSALIHEAPKAYIGTCHIRDGLGRR